MKKWLPLLLSITLLVVQIIMYRALRHFPEIVERWYSTGIYPYIGRAMRFGLGWIPFSFGDVFYVLVILLAVRWLIVHFKEVVTLSRKRYTQLFVTLNVVLAFFHAAWGLNYYRQPLHKILELESTYTDEELLKVTRQLVYTSNELHKQLQSQDSLAVDFKRSQADLFELAPSGFENLGSVDPSLTYGPNSIKKSLLTLPLTYMGYSGYLNPMTGEAQTNGYINNYKTPVLILHEMSHQLGFAKENEANFIAVIAGMKHVDPYFQYSASIFALRYCLNDLYLKDPEAFELLRPEITPGIFKNYKELDDFWGPYDDNVIEKVSQASYNTYLQANNQPDGMRTYSYVVALLVNYYK
ncbi:DUF3810 domain-containing protein [Nonlabens agnitus]|uniref:3-deoxy-manno-octulosonate cytidylyltransferase n=1 Tax=Nonlabens agnitus TaxID=870484 RepID=A0A2S9WTL9_9FLAO|nr:DUF3810 domain-containing protein [Nonlabens agnitus]PRP66656.1 3-deoxy-manno-octulosonate cytidylyltransferase [Nonlabens agnitus]